MTANTLEERRRHINEIKSSFQNPAQSGQYQDIALDAPVPKTGFGFWKGKLVIAVVLFGIFVYCRQNEIKLGTYAAKDVCQMVQEDLSLEKTVETVKIYLRLGP